MKGIILAGGVGTRLFPLTLVASKQLMPVYDKPMIYYPLSTLMLMGINEILIISTPHDTPRFKRLLGNGNSLGLKIDYEIQSKPNGIAEAFIIGDKFIDNDDVALILGDNLFYGSGYIEKIKSNINKINGAIIFGCSVKYPNRYGVVDLDDDGNVLSIEEKPSNPKTNYAVPGLYLYDKNVVNIAKELKPSDRGELEITDLNKKYLECGKLKVELLGRGLAWLDTGTHKSLMEASAFIETIESRQGLKVACLEEIALDQGFINKQELELLIETYPDNEYVQYIKNII